jgi:ribosomal protein S6--L-glutamate ligase
MTILSFHPCFGAHKQIILGPRTLNREDRLYIGLADAIILPQGCPAELYHACAQSGAAVFPEYRVRFQYPGKIGQARLFREWSFPHPETCCWKDTEDLRAFLEKGDPLPHGFPFFLKMDRAHEGEGVFFIEDEADLQDVLAQLSEREVSGIPGFLTQAAVPTCGNVLRAVIIGNDVFTFWKRPAQKGGMITNISKGGLIDRIWRPDLQKRVVAEAGEVARRTGINLAAVDFAVAVEEAHPQPFVLEINYFFARRGLGGTMRYYRYLYGAIREWLTQRDLDPDRVVLY